MKKRRKERERRKRREKSISVGSGFFETRIYIVLGFSKKKSFLRTLSHDFDF